MANVKDLEPYAANVEGLIAILEDFRKNNTYYRSV